MNDLNQAEKRAFLIKRLLDEDKRYRGMEVPADTYEQKRMLRSLMNIRRPQAIDTEFLTVQDEYLRQELEDTGITRLDDLEPVCGDFYLWQGDITRLRCGAIVNAANSGMTGCYVPCHACIDNCIHTFAGIQLRLDCAELMERQGHEEPTGQAKITKAYNLPCDYVLHTVGPIMVNLATYVGSSQAGFGGAVLATLAVVLPSFFVILLVMNLLRGILKGTYAQAVLQGLKPCMIGIILATGVYMTLHNCFPLVQGAKVDFRALLIVVLLVACMSMYRILKKKKLSPILLIIASAALGILIY